MSVLSVIQSHCKIHALRVPTGIISNTDTTIIQLFAILNEVVEELVTESKFNVTNAEAVFTATAAEDQGSLYTLAPSGYQWMLPRTLYNRTLGRACVGPLSEEQWQQFKALPDPGPDYKYRIKNDHLFLLPAPTAPLSEIAFEYASSWAIKDGTTGDLKAAMTADTDVFVFPETIIKKGLTWRWKYNKGLPYAVDETAYYNLLNNYIARDKTKPDINVGCDGGGAPKPGIFVPYGSWNQ